MLQADWVTMNYVPFGEKALSMVVNLYQQTAHDLSVIQFSILHNIIEVCYSLPVSVLCEVYYSTNAAVVCLLVGLFVCFCLSRMWLLLFSLNQALWITSVVQSGLFTWWNSSHFMIVTQLKDSLTTLWWQSYLPDYLKLIFTHKTHILPVPSSCGYFTWAALFFTEVPVQLDMKYEFLLYQFINL